MSHAIRIGTSAGDRNVSEYEEQTSRQRFDHLEIPAYFLAEWIAENWWPLLWEPRKNEDAKDDPDFLSRHSILAAQHGFVLPSVKFIPAGRVLQIEAEPREVLLSEVRFRNASTVSGRREVIEHQLRSFVSAVCARLDQAHIHGTELQEAWAAVLDVAPDEQLFCRLSGALGMDPDEVTDTTATLLDRLLERLGERLLMDLCLVSPAGSFETIATTAEVAFAGLGVAPTTNIEPLLSLPTPTDNFAVPAWRRGVQAAKQLRTRLGIKENDPSGASRVFGSLKLSTDRYGEDRDNETSLTGAVARDDAAARVALLQPSLLQRRFTAARAIYMAWTSEDHETRYLTSAVTRDQQASRAFAAELTAPLALLQSKRSMLTRDGIQDLAAELQIGPDVVAKQAFNNGLIATH
jgi:hypothetical protein